ncbi:hypothetical protein [Leptolyngbya sp. 7M]|uniref:hypothetical protein n=1 Tax=Leptolyngbya sp. 7M TaxID=2812896 RepID=UPI001B8D1F23|nr:hypothetical protein [Leptolyngbya sp. 7M]QYO68233.1 hypothetical protein JVX88_16585 [Leptolyngbya sp. 7M]
MSQQPIQQSGFPRFRFAEFELLCLEIAAATTLTTLTFATLGSLVAKPAAAKPVPAPSVIITDAAPETVLNTSLDTPLLEADISTDASGLGEPMSLQVEQISDFDCVIAVAWQDKPYCSASGNSEGLVFDPISLQFTLENSTRANSQLRLFEVQF